MSPVDPATGALQNRFRRYRPRLAAVLLAAVTASLVGCGGGLYLSYEFPIGVVDDRAPSVQISALPASVPAGAALILGATAVDEDGIAEVSLYRIDGNGFATFLAADRSPPFEWTTLIPGDGRPTVSYFARAVDGRGRVGDSAVVTAGIRY
jgi:hypothetical protein